MNPQKKNTTKTSILKSAAFLFLCAAFGGVLGYFSVDFAQNIPSLVSVLNSGLETISVWLLFLSVVFNGAAILFYCKGSNFAKHAAQDDSAFEQANRLLSLCLIITCASIGWVLIFSGISISFLFHSNQMLFGLICTVFLLFEIIFNSVMQSKVIKLTKQLAPEKRGNVMDMNFQKDWYNSCDEAEQKAIGDYCYFTFRIMNTVYPFLLAILIALAIGYSINPFIILMIGALWMVQNMSYVCRSYWMEHGKSKR